MSGAVGANRLDFSHLLVPHDLSQFLEEYWQRKPFATQLPDQTFEEILAQIGPLDVPAVAERASEGCQAWLCNEYVAHSVFPCDAANADEFFEAGATLYFLNVPIPGITRAISDALGVPAHRVIASLFLTPANNGAAAHFDKNENFTIQLTGMKRWIVGERPALESAPEGHVWGRELNGDNAVLASDVEDPPRHAIDLMPGTLLYVPRGAVHSTEAKEASWSLNISYTGYMWVDLFCSGLRNELLKIAHWRESVIGLGDQSNSDARRRNRIAALTQELRELLKVEPSSEGVDFGRSDGH